MPSTVTCRVEGSIAQVRLNRPDKLNALTLDTLEELVSTARELGRDRTLRGVVLGGEGDSFCAGLDFATVLRNPPRVARSFVPHPWRGTNLFQEACWAWRRLRVPVVAAVHGHCYGGGLQIALAADLRMTTADAQWSVLEAKWGLVPDMSGIHALSQQVRMDVAKRLTMTGEVGERRAGRGAGPGERGARRAVRRGAPASSSRSATRSPDSVAATKRLFGRTWTPGDRRTFARGAVRAGQAARDPEHDHRAGGGDEAPTPRSTPGRPHDRNRVADIEGPPRRTAGEVRHITCNLCEAICGLEVTLDSAAPPIDPRQRGRPAVARAHLPQGVALPDVHEDPDRLRRPVRRTGDDGWREIGWDEALDLVADRLAAAVNEHGRRRARHLPRQPQRAQPRLADPRHRAGEVAPHPQQVQRHLGRPAARTSCVAYLMYGHQLLLPIPDIDRTSLLPGLRRQPDGLQRLADDRARLPAPAARAQGAAAAGWSCSTRAAPRPPRSPTSTTSSGPAPTRSCCWRCCSVLFAEGLATPAGVRRRASTRCASAVAAVHPRARRGGQRHRRPTTSGAWPASSRRRRVRGRLRPGRGLHAGVRAGVPVGGPAAQPAHRQPRPAGRRDVHDARRSTSSGRGLVGRGHHDVWRSRVRGLPEFGGELPVAALREEIETPGEGQVRALLTLAGNPVLSTPDGPRLDEALAGLDFMAAVDIYVNETTRHADVILPPTTALERDHYDLVFHVLAVRNTARFTPAGAPRSPRARCTTGRSTASSRCACRARGGGRGRAGLAGVLTAEARLRLSPRRQLDALLRRRGARLSVEKLGRRPRGVDLGPLGPGDCPSGCRPGPPDRPRARAGAGDPAAAAGRPSTGRPAVAAGRAAADRAPAPAGQQLLDAQHAAAHPGPAAPPAADAPRRPGGARHRRRRLVAVRVAGRRGRGRGGGDRRHDAGRGVPPPRLRPPARRRPAASGAARCRASRSTT